MRFKEESRQVVATKRSRYVKHHIPGQKINIWIREKTKVTDVIEQERKRKWTAGYEITDGHCVSQPGNHTKGKDLVLEESRRDDGETN